MPWQPLGPSAGALASYHKMLDDIIYYNILVLDLIGGLIDVVYMSCTTARMS